MGHSCALINGGTIKCWGFQGSYGQLGNGSLTSSTSPVSVSGISNAIQITAGENHNYALLSDYTVKCWGENRYGQLGDGTKTTRTTPVLVTDLSDVKQVSAGRGHTCALLNAGTVKCWSLYVAESITPVYVYE
jgi:alpha-tubulin suppressor-like RCC1 family protein